MHHITLTSFFSFVGNCFGDCPLFGDCPNADAVRSAEALARSNHAGVWSGNHTKPWDYRKSKR